MSNIRANVEIDIDEITSEIIDSSDFGSAIESAIDDYDFSYQFDNQIDRALENLDFVDSDNLTDKVICILANDKGARNAIESVIPWPATPQTTTLNPEVLEALALCHKTIGQLSQQIAVINAMCGASVWPNSTTENLHRLYGILESFGYVFEV